MRSSQQLSGPEPRRRGLAPVVVMLLVVGGVAWWLGSGDATPQPSAPGAIGPAERLEVVPAAAASASADAPSLRTEPPAGSTAPGPAAPTAVGQAMWVAQLLREDGQPVSAATCACWIRRGSEFRFVATTADDAGWLRIAAPADFDGADRRLAITARSRERLAAPWTHGEMRLADSYPPGDVSLGIVPMIEQGFLFSGAVRDARGAAVRDAAVFAMPVELDLLEMRNPRLPERFRCDTDAEGRFEIFGPALHPEYLLVCRHPGMHQVAPVRSRTGATGLAIDMAAAGEVVGSVELSAHVDWRQVFLLLSGPPVLGHLGSSTDDVLSAMRPLRAGEALRIGLDARGRFRADSLRQGSMDVAVHVWGRATPVASIAGVWVEAGKVCEEPRLQRIPLASLRTVRVTFVTESGAAMTRPMVVGTKDSDQSEWSRRVTERDGTMRVPTATGSFDLLVQQAGIRRELVTDIRGDRTIQVANGIPVRVAVHLGGGSLPGHELSLQLVGTEVDRHPEFEDPRVPRSDSAVVTDGVEVQLCVPAAGRYRPVVHLRRLGVQEDERVVVGTSPLADRDIASPAATKPWGVRLEAAELQQAERVIRTLFGPAAATTPR